MVTDEERDYMYSVYAADPQMRAQRRHPPPAGAARREQPPPHRAAQLAALLASRARRSSTTATRSGWATTSTSAIATASARRCSGAAIATAASRAPIRRGCYAPPIQDPVYGYQAINVEAQERYPFSLLNWMKRLIAMRKQHRVFGRGSLEFVGCPNRKVLAYLRRDDRETILVVANLSRAVQPAELDLQAFAGLIPIEMTGLTEFPRIGEHAVFPDAGPLRARTGSRCSATPMQVTPRGDGRRRSERRDRSRRCRRCWSASTGRTCSTAARARCSSARRSRPFLQRQRWFASKSREIRQARFTDWATARNGRRPAFLADRVGRVHRRLDRELSSCRSRCSPARPPSAR